MRRRMFVELWEDDDSFLVFDKLDNLEDNLASLMIDLQYGWDLTHEEFLSVIGEENYGSQIEVIQAEWDDNIVLFSVGDNDWERLFDIAERVKKKLAWLNTEYESEKLEEVT